MTALLEVENLHSYYGKSHILQGVSLSVNEGEVVTLLGRNGAGKSTTLKSIAGTVTPGQGRVVLAGQDVAGQPAFRIAKSGVCLVPENRGIFSLLTVEENLRVACRKGSAWSIRDIYGIFPRLEERRRNGGGQLSGGEQQMLSIARTLMGRPEMLMLDEPLEGLAPVICDMLMETFDALARDGRHTILLVEQHTDLALRFAEQVVILDAGSIVHAGPAEALRLDPSILERHVGVGLAAPPP